MIESPEIDVVFEPVPTKDDDEPGKGLLPVEQDLEPRVARPQYISSSFRQSFKLLREQGGRKGYFRGLLLAIIHTMAVNLVTGFLFLMTPILLPRSIYNIIATVICAQLSLAWTLIVITRAVNKPWYRRLPNFDSWKKIAGPTALHSIVRHTAIIFPLYLGLPTENTNLSDKAVTARAVGSLFLMIAMLVVLVFPAEVILTRVQASMISSSEETIVPFDRTFDGKFVSTDFGGRGVIGICDAWRTFDRSARLRLLKAYGKVFALLFAGSTLFAIVVGLEFLIIGLLH
jgi:hypothetical protein